MTYSISVDVTGAGPSVTTTGDVPEGKFIVSGHVEEAGSSLQVTRFSVTGVPVASASASSTKGA